MKAWVLPWLLLALPSCTCAVNLDQLTFACTVDSECGPGLLCRNGQCEKEGAGGGGGGGDGGAACFVDGGTVQTGETLCADGRDNDCDGLVDCADPQCNTSSCGSPGRICSALACICTSDGGVQTAESTCTDGKDNDCDGLIDCADSDCNTLVCGTAGRVCNGTTCSCGGNGGAAETSETTCGDTRDNDCDGMADCLDSQCKDMVCGLNGQTCKSSVCICSGNGGSAQAVEIQCTDGKDNDCDGLIDCADSTCEGRSCGTGCSCVAAVKAEVICTGGADEDGDGLADCADSDCAGRSCGAGCVCSGAVKVETVCGNATDDDGDGLTDCADSNCCVGCPGACELNCSDGADDDGNALIDCADSKCGGRTCGANGKVCDGTTCLCSGNGGISQLAESSCFDGFDNDCDGLIDCADPSCVARACTCEVNCKDGVDNDCNGQIDCADSKCLHAACSATTAASVCCSTGASATSCKDLGSDESNCGGCGLACASNRTCVAATSGTISSGRCDCSNSGMCPASQSCSGDCKCSAASNCAAGQACTNQLCSYP